MRERFRVRLSKEHGGIYFMAYVFAESEKEAFLKAKNKAEAQGIELPDEIWTTITNKP